MKEYTDYNEAVIRETEESFGMRFHEAADKKTIDRLPKLKCSSCGNECSYKFMQYFSYNAHKIQCWECQHPEPENDTYGNGEDLDNNLPF